MDEKVAIGPVEIKSEELGQVSAVIATLSVIDKDNDYTFPGAFETGAQVDVSLYGHSLYAGGLPVGEGRLREERRLRRSLMRSSTWTRRRAGTRSRS